MRVAIDTNVLISAIIKPHNRIGLIVVRLRNDEFVFLYSMELLEEITDVLSRPKIWKKYALNQETVEIFIRSLIEHGEVVRHFSVVSVCRDPDDNLLLALAVDGKADYIISGDKDLLSLHPFQGIPIVEPARFLDILENA